MPSADDLQSHATSTTDFYSLLDLSPSFASQKELDRAWRRAALRYHPDKVGADNLEAADKFHLVSVGYEVLSDAGLRATYDQARSAREQRRQRIEREDALKRAMREDLEARERAGASGIKRSAAAAFSDEDRAAMEIRQLAAETQAQRQRLKEKRARERAAAEPAEHGVGPAMQEEDTAAQLPEPTERDRMVKVRFERAGAAEKAAEDEVRDMCAGFGPVELVFARPDRRVKPVESGRSGKIVLGCVAVVFRSLLGAIAAVEDWRDAARDAVQRDGQASCWAFVQSVDWAQGEEPAAVKAWAESTRLAAARGPSRAKPKPDASRNPGQQDFKPVEPGAKPTFSSFKPGATGHKQKTANGPTLEELTFMKMRHAEKRRQEAAALDAVDGREEGEL